MIIEITQISNNLQAKNVRIAYQARNEDRTINVSGRFELSSEKFKENEDLVQLEVLAKEHMEKELSA